MTRDPLIYSTSAPELLPRSGASPGTIHWQVTRRTEHSWHCSRNPPVAPQLSSLRAPLYASGLWPVRGPPSWCEADWRGRPSIRCPSPVRRRCRPDPWSVGSCRPDDSVHSRWVDHPESTDSNRSGQDRGVSKLIVGIGGSIDPDSQSERALRAVLAAAQQEGASTASFTGLALDFAPYHSGAVLPSTARDYIEAVRSADGIVISSPGYHGTVSGLVKNALDYLEELRTDSRPYLDG